MANGTTKNRKQRDPAPFWWPDAQGLVISVVMANVTIALFYRMTHPAEINDKLLDMMLTILFGTAFVGIINYLIGSSRGSSSKDEATNRIVDKLTSPPPNGPVAPVLVAPVAPAPVVVMAWWGLLTKEEQAKIEAAAADTRVAAFVANSKVGKATSEDLQYLVGLGLLTAERATAIQST